MVLRFTLFVFRSTLFLFTLYHILHTTYYILIYYLITNFIKFNLPIFIIMPSSTVKSIWGSLIFSPLTLTPPCRTILIASPVLPRIPESLTRFTIPSFPSFKTSFFISNFFKVRIRNYTKHADQH